MLQELIRSIDLEVTLPVIKAAVNGRENPTHGRDCVKESGSHPSYGRPAQECQFIDSVAQVDVLRHDGHFKLARLLNSRSYGPPDGGGQNFASVDKQRPPAEGKCPNSSPPPSLAWR